jgi:hypothetical protein
MMTGVIAQRLLYASVQTTGLATDSVMLPAIRPSAASIWEIVRSVRQIARRLGREMACATPSATLSPVTMMRRPP